MVVQRDLIEGRMPTSVTYLSVLGIVLTVACLMLGAYVVDWHRMLQVIAGADLGLIGLASVCQVATFFLFSLRWRQLIAVDNLPPLPRIFNFLMIGYLANAILPARPGDIIRAVLLRQVFGISFSYGFASVVVERLFDVLAICSLGVIVSFTVALPPLLLAGLYSLAAAGLGLVSALLVLTWRYASIGKLAARFPALFRYFFMRFLAEWLERFTSALRILYSAARMSISVLLTCLGWGTLVVSFMILINAFQMRVSPAAALLVLASTNLGAVIPSSPGALGIYHFTAVLALSVWHVDMSTAVAFAIGAHAISIALHIVFGLSCAWIEGVGVRRLTSLAQTAD
jgi:glycosyltransferase 2 family protein